MKRFHLLFIEPFTAVLANGQYTGGSVDRFSDASIANQNALPGIYYCGNDDALLIHWAQAKNLFAWLIKMRTLMH